MTFELPKDGSSGLGDGDVLTEANLEANFAAIEDLLNDFPTDQGDGAGSISANAITFAMIGCEATATSLGTSDELLPTQNAVKAYVDAQVSPLVLPSSLTYASDSNGEIAIGELELKWGTATLTGTGTDITFASESGITAFTNACFQVFVTDQAYNANNENNTIVSVVSSTAFSVVHQEENNSIRWFAIGR